MSLEHSYSSKRGQGLLEVIIAIGVIIAGTVGTITLIVTTIKAGRSTNNRVVAASLAREAIEVVRNTRDSNWLKIQANETAGTFTGLFNPATPRHVTYPVFNETANTWSVLPVAVGGNFTTDCVSGVSLWDCSQVYQRSNVYRQCDTPPPGCGAITRFKRLTFLHPICRKDVTAAGGSADGIPDVNPPQERIIQLDDGSANSTCASDEILVGVQALSTVCWDDDDCSDDRTKFQLEERLYNWKYVK